MYAINHFKDFSLILFTELNVTPYPHLKHVTLLEISDVLQWNQSHCKDLLKTWHKLKTEHTNQQYQGWDKRPYYMSEDDKDHKTYQNECENSGKDKFTVHTL